MHEIRRQFHSVDQDDTDQDDNSSQSEEPSMQHSVKSRQQTRQLFDLKWYRVILDEAHAIKNIHSKKILPYLEFIGCNCEDDLQEFRRRYMIEHDLEANSGSRFTKSVFEEMAKGQKSLKIGEGDERPTAQLVAQPQLELTRIYAEQYMHLRMVLSHPYNIEKFLRTDEASSRIHVLRKALNDIEEEKGVMHQLLEDSKLVAELEPYRSGVDRMGMIGGDALGGYVKLDVCLNLIQIEQKARESTCASCNRTPEMAAVAVLVIGLKAGGQSLNLACANRILIIDPWWNVTAEQQAIGRAHRIGQKKECHVVRLFTDAKMDAAILNLQAVKSEEVDYALQDDGHVPPPLDEKQRRELCSLTTRAKKGKEKQGAAKPAFRGGRRLKRQAANPEMANNGSGRKRRRGE
ncbi:hypothetical protein E4U41_007053 [Claviceps citrina]|nr:hypothetical protein E4U41_007053 [Claviceps citrina]